MCSECASVESASARVSVVITTRAYDCEMETPHATGPVAPGLEDEVARLIARACGTVEPAGAAQVCGDVTLIDVAWF